MMLKDKIKKECENQGIQLKDMLKEANVNLSSFYSVRFREIWKTRIAQTLGVNEEKFFKGHEEEIYIRSTPKSEIEYEKIKPIVIERLEKDWLTVKEIQDLVNISYKQAITLISTLRHNYEIKSKSVERQKIKKMFHIIQKLDRDKKSGKNIIPIENLSPKIKRTHLLDWAIDNTYIRFETTRELIAYAQQHNKQVI